MAVSPNLDDEIVEDSCEGASTDVSVDPIQNKSKGRTPKRKAVTQPGLLSLKKAKKWSWTPEAMVTGFRGFVGVDSPGDNPMHVKEGYPLTCKQALTNVDTQAHRAPLCIN